MNKHKCNENVTEIVISKYCLEIDDNYIVRIRKSLNKTYKNRAK